MRIGFRHCLLAGCLLLAEAAVTAVMCLAGQPGVGSEPTGGNAAPRLGSAPRSLIPVPSIKAVPGSCGPWDSDSPACPSPGSRW